MLAPPPLTFEFMGMVSYAPTTFHELLDDEVESDDSSIGDVEPSHRLSWECSVADALGQPSVVVESLQTHTPPNPHAGSLALAQEHVKELQQWRQNQPPPAPVRSMLHVAPYARDLVSSA